MAVLIGFRTIKFGSIQHFRYPSLFTGLEQNKSFSANKLLKCFQILILICFFLMLSFSSKKTSSISVLPNQTVFIILDHYQEESDFEKRLLKHILKLSKGKNICLYHLSETLSPISPCTQNSEFIYNAFEQHNFYTKAAFTHLSDIDTTQKNNTAWHLIDSLNSYPDTKPEFLILSKSPFKQIEPFIGKSAKTISFISLNKEASSKNKRFIKNKEILIRDIAVYNFINHDSKTFLTKEFDHLFKQKRTIQYSSYPVFKTPIIILLILLIGIEIVIFCFKQLGL